MGASFTNCGRAPTTDIIFMFLVYRFLGGVYWLLEFPYGVFVLDRMNQNQDFAIKYLSDPQFKADIDRVLLPLIHDRLNRKA